VSDELPAGWVRAKLSDLAEYNPKHPKGTSDAMEVSFVPMPLVQEGSASLRLEKVRPFGEVKKGYTHFSNGDVLLAKITPCFENGKAAVAAGLKNGLGCGTTELHVLRPLGGILPEYLYHLLHRQALRDDIKTQMTGTAGQLRVPSDVILSMEIPLAPFAEQQRIVAKLDQLLPKLQACKERLERIPATLKRFRQVVLAAAVSGKLTEDWRRKHPDLADVRKDLTSAHLRKGTGRTSGREATDVVIRGIGALSVGDTGHGLPNGWLRVPLRQVAVLESGHTPSRKHPEYWGGDVPWVSIPDAREHHGKRIFTTRQSINKVGLANSSARLLPKDTVCLSRTASVGYVFIMGNPMATSQDFVNWVCGEALVPEFLSYCLLAEGDHIREFGRGTTHTTIYFPEVKAIHITLPSVAEQKEIVRLLDASVGKLIGMESYVSVDRDRVASLEQAILSRAFSGWLVHQDPQDEPASELLERIRQQKHAPHRRPGKPSRAVAHRRARNRGGLRVTQESA
jgi:type I restriction enzyme, S subunit